MISNKDKEDLKELIKAFEYKDKHSHFGTSYTTEKACQVSSLYGLNRGDLISTLVDENGEAQAFYIKGKKSIAF